MTTYVDADGRLHDEAWPPEPSMGTPAPGRPLSDFTLIPGRPAMKPRASTLCDVLPWGARRALVARLRARSERAARYADDGIGGVVSVDAQYARLEAADARERARRAAGELPARTALPTAVETDVGTVRGRMSPSGYVRATDGPSIGIVRAGRYLVDHLDAPTWIDATDPHDVTYRPCVRVWIGDGIVRELPAACVAIPRAARQYRIVDLGDTVDCDRAESLRRYHQRQRGRSHSLVAVWMRRTHTGATGK